MRSSLCSCFGGIKPLFVGYMNSDMADDVDTRRSSLDYLFTFGGGAMSWRSKL